MHIASVKESFFYNKFSMLPVYQCICRLFMPRALPSFVWLFLLVASASHAKAQEWKAVSTAERFRLSTVVIEDLRPQVSTRGIELPFISSPGQVDRVWPKISETDETRTKAAIQSYFKGSDQATAVTVRYQILDACQQFSATMSAEREDAFVRIRIDILDANNNVLFTSTTEKGLRKNRLDATYKSITKLYQTVWDQALAEGMRALAPSAAVGQLN